MAQYGYEIVQTLIVDIEPDERVKRAMNEINAGMLLSWQFFVTADIAYCTCFLFHLLMVEIQVIFVPSSLELAQNVVRIFVYPISNESIPIITDDYIFDFHGFVICILECLIPYICNLSREYFQYCLSEGFVRKIIEGFLETCKDF